MADGKEFFIGIDPTAGQNAYTWAVIDSSCQCVAHGGGERDALQGLVDKYSPKLVAINGPMSVNKGLIRTRMIRDLAPRQIRGADMRMAEQQLREKGISIPPTPARVETCQVWIQMGFRLYDDFQEDGYSIFPSPYSDRSVLEVNSHATFCALLGHLPLPKPTLEGRLQRQLILREKGAVIQDPMDFFEEITRHKILRGILPMEFLYTPQELDALAAGLTAWWAVYMPGEITMVGNTEEGQIVIPVKELNELYK